ncbi:MAG TPA: hypothetical protein VGX22_14280 [Candidatus Dormibacteraeota bacterium]|nr:hypothetical protein [Candidatus Dormibacteraeota bacterium]
MDVFNGAVGTNQVHDFNPGIRQPGGLFWTLPVSEDALEVDLEDGTATLALDDFDTDDYGNLRNALTGGAEVDASVSFKMKWTATGDRFNVSDPVHTFAGRFSLATVSIEWSGTVPSTGFKFTSDPSSNLNVKSVIGRERNGIFFSE